MYLTGHLLWVGLNLLTDLLCSMFKVLIRSVDLISIDDDETDLSFANLTLHMSRVRSLLWTTLNLCS